ncbi:uncharacterized protein BP01DRAFT_26155 [Aspergillus saccharolyticus JOP 1030-1]|uniref:Uncharacterized protein n=1 Tax=Aspergillus saccharolyticus JOP 1030-1 TaxID=1450539 RepID=A0A318ZP55_9EURO|nr:hypothetical protein BP01DRAFT_26155 [Aspergillus saccharolyticus JOP 1030-1]PYH46233.1 hypothetical protein BP01DRAFT_26155 [Aspergillus saccharolyticus JOP 1030-1]
MAILAKTSSLACFLIACLFFSSLIQALPVPGSKAPAGVTSLAARSPREIPSDSDDNGILNGLLEALGLPNLTKLNHWKDLNEPKGSHSDPDTDTDTDTDPDTETDPETDAEADQDPEEEESPAEEDTEEDTEEDSSPFTDFSADTDFPTEPTDSSDANPNPHNHFSTSSYSNPFLPDTFKNNFKDSLKDSLMNWRDNYTPSVDDGNNLTPTVDTADDLTETDADQTNNNNGALADAASSASTMNSEDQGQSLPRPSKNPQGFVSGLTQRLEDTLKAAFDSQDELTLF